MAHTGGTSGGEHAGVLRHLVGVVAARQEQDLYAGHRPLERRRVLEAADGDIGPAEVAGPLAVADERTHLRRPGQVPDHAPSHLPGRAGDEDHRAAADSKRERTTGGSTNGDGPGHVRSS